MSAVETIKIFDFHGGIHPPENKVQSLTKKITSAPIPSTLIIPVSQPGFREAEILVNVGDSVKKGQIIARGTHATGIVYHASSSGTVAAIDEQTMPNAAGLSDLCISITTDGKDEWLPRQSHSDYSNLSAAEIVTLVSEAGISGLGGAGFPTHIKLGGKPEHIDTLIINACECEPFITADDVLMRERADEVITGIRILMQVLKPERCLIGIEDNKPEAIAAMNSALKTNDSTISVISVPTKYPSGSEKQLIYILTGKEVKSGGLPAHAGIVCQNTGTAYAIKRAVCDGEALVSRITTVTGAAIETPRNLDVLIGTPIPHLLEHCGLDKNKLSRVIMGGSLMGVSLAEIDAPILKITNCLIATTDSELPLPQAAQACIRCGQCTEVCPAHLLPQQLYWFARSKEHDKAMSHNIMDCIECGACAYVCPSSIPLVHYYRAAKGEIRSEQEKHKRGELSQQRYEYHEQRLEKEKAKQEERRKQRAELVKKKKAAAAAEANNGDSDSSGTKSSDDAIQAALDRVKAKKAAALKKDKAPSNTEKSAADSPDNSAKPANKETDPT